MASPSLNYLRKQRVKDFDADISDDVRQFAVEQIHSLELIRRVSGAGTHLNRSNSGTIINTDLTLSVAFCSRIVRQNQEHATSL